METGSVHTQHIHVQPFIHDDCKTEGQFTFTVTSGHHIWMNVWVIFYLPCPHPKRQYGQPILSFFPPSISALCMIMSILNSGEWDDQNSWVQLYGINSYTHIMDLMYASEVILSTIWNHWDCPLSTDTVGSIVARITESSGFINGLQMVKVNCSRQLSSTGLSLGLRLPRLVKPLDAACHSVP